MRVRMRSFNVRIALALFALAIMASAAPTCDPGNAGLTLPAGFCAFLAIDGIGAARHIAVAPNGDVYVALQGNGDKGGVAALRSTKGDGKFDVKEHFGSDSLTGIGVRNGYVYVASFHEVLRYK